MKKYLILGILFLIIGGISLGSSLELLINHPYRCVYGAASTPPPSCYPSDFQFLVSYVELIVGTGLVIVGTWFLATNYSKNQKTKDNIVAGLAVFAVAFAVMFTIIVKH